MKNILIILLAFLAATPLIAMAASPTQIAPDTDASPSDYRFELYEHDTIVNFDQNFYADQVEFHSDYVYFSNVALGSASNPTQTFGIGAEDGNATINEISTGDVTIEMDCGGECSGFYYYPSGVNVFAVEVDGENIAENLYYSDSSQFASADAPAVLETSSYVQVKVSGTTIKFYVTPSGSSTGGGSLIIPLPQLPPTTSGSAFGLQVTPPVFNAPPGTLQTQDFILEWRGATKFVVSDFSFYGQGSEWLTLNKPVPFAATIEPGAETLRYTVPATVAVPEGVELSEVIVTARITASSAAMTQTIEVPVKVVLKPAIDINLLYVFGGIIMAIAVAGFVKSRRGR